MLRPVRDAPGPFTLENSALRNQIYDKFIYIHGRCIYVFTQPHSRPAHTNTQEKYAKDGHTPEDVLWGGNIKK